MMRSAVLYPAKVEKLQEKFANIHHQLSSSQTVTHSQCDIIEESWRWTHSQRHFCNFIYQFPFLLNCWVLSTSVRRTSINSNICRYHQNKCIHYYKYARGVSLCNLVLRSILFTSRAKMFHPRKQVHTKVAAIENTVKSLTLSLLWYSRLHVHCDAPASKLELLN